MEAKDMYIEQIAKEKESEINGVNIKEREENDIKISYVNIDQNGAKTIGKKAGSYVTIYADGVKKQDTKKQSQAATVLSKELIQLLEHNNIQEDDLGLVVGLGN